ncbi:MAG: septum formation protein Maf [Ruminococcus sp.]|nr:septum formation protein Maf [Ruminococcus sp.]
MKSNNVILASASPRRQELLKKIFPEFKIIPADIDESYGGDISATEVAQFLAEKKAEHISKMYPDSLVIGSDTTVVSGDIILGKPENETDAVRMLKLLSGNAHKVITGVSLFSGEFSYSFSETTEVLFHELSDSEIAGYIKTGEWSDKAGAYGIQGAAGAFVEKINGSFDNVVGLPCEKLKAVLKEKGFLN